jgi:hypothetical protein
MKRGTFPPSFRPPASTRSLGIADQKWHFFFAEVKRTMVPRKADKETMFRQFLLILLAASIIAPPVSAHAQASARPQIVPPALSTIQPLEVGPPPGAKDEIELSPTPVDYAVEHPLLMEITVFQQEPLPASERHSNDSSSARIYTWSVRLATDGTPSGSGYSGYVSVGEFQGWGPGTPLSADSLAKVKSLIATLPEDHGRIQPRNHKVQVEIATHHGTEKRMYDAANLPEALLEIFRLTDTNFTPLVPEFAPDSGLAAPPAAPGLPDTNVLAVSHNGDLMVTLHGSIPEWAQLIDTREAQAIASGRQQPGPGDNWAPWPQVLGSSGQTIFRIPPLPDFSQRSTRFRAAWFTRNDRYLVLSTDVPSILIYDTKNWQPIRHIPEVPSEALDFEPSPDWKSAVAVFPSGEIDIWDVSARQRVSRIDCEGELRSVAWAPNNRLVAVHTVTGQPSASHLRVWDAETGKLEHELLPFEQGGRAIETPLWWPNGKYLLARTSSMFGRPVIGVWNVQSGRYQGSFTGAECNSGYPGVRLDERYLTMNCEHQSPVVWDAESGIRAIAAFEDSQNAER